MAARAQIAVDGVALGLRLFLAATFALSSRHKLTNLKAFARGISAYRILPETLTTAAAILVVGFELSIAVILVLGTTWAWVGAAALLALFAGAQAAVLARRVEVACNCFDSTHAVSKYSLLRTLFVLGLTVILMAQPPNPAVSVVALSMGIIISCASAWMALWIGNYPDVAAVLSQAEDDK
jgi:uncharacterized membrane protein YphA (DoxX/SURF4 family)